MAGNQDALLVKEKLHPDSVVVITSRDGALLRECCSHVEPVNPLSEELAHALFASHAFKLKEMPAAVRERAAKVVKACGGLPLTLEVVTCQTPPNGTCPNSLYEREGSPCRCQKRNMSYTREEHDHAYASKGTCPNSCRYGLC